MRNLKEEWRSEWRSGGGRGRGGDGSVTNECLRGLGERLTRSQRSQCVHITTLLLLLLLFIIILLLVLLLPPSRKGRRVSDKHVVEPRKDADMLELPESKQNRQCEAVGELINRRFAPMHVKSSLKPGAVRGAETSSSLLWMFSVVTDSHSDSAFEARLHGLMCTLVRDGGKNIVAADESSHELCPNSRDGSLALSLVGPFGRGHSQRRTLCLQGNYQEKVDKIPFGPLLICSSDSEEVQASEGHGDRECHGHRAPGKCFAEVSAADKVFMTRGQFSADIQELHATGPLMKVS
ncbi:unnamed protein product [Pleuronectes platessa]|uniref:Uncharacterized protein n=1 Tax=Pleuronectes platessa TaxID=8262 RepID=A0A9N7VEL2_PLEPL|nr:unnamed protein product [Pleuronectes platessa]